MNDPNITPGDVGSNDAPSTVPGDAEQSVYRFIVVAAKRARQLQSGARPKVHATSRKMTRIAIEETRKGLVPYFDPETAPPPEAEPEPEALDQ